jgi:hypothetical protein
MPKPFGNFTSWQAIHYFKPGNPSTTYYVFLRPSSWNWYEVARDGELPLRTKTGLSGYAGYGQADIYGNMPFLAPAIVCSLKIQSFLPQNTAFTSLSFYCPLEYSGI